MALACILLTTPTSFADERLERLLMPGPLTGAHADLEDECEKCHAAFRKTSQTELCVDCHEEIGSDRRKQEGFHGRNAQARETDCVQCHSDHNGRDADIVLLNPAYFNHRSTDFELEGAHKTVPCTDCHRPGKLYRETPRTCISCHESDEPHRGELGRDCAKCHSASAWTESGFDHADTEFELSGRHRDIECASCHTGEHYSDLPMKCVDCHAIDDVHTSRFGGECEDCHSESKWSDSHFDHKAESDFELRDSHKSLACAACHTKPLFDQDLPDSCIGCHRKDDIHAGRNGERCQECHRADKWHRDRFNHAAKTDFRLLGAHADLACVSCHHDNVYEKQLGSDCVDCHAAQDIHDGALGEACDECHTSVTWESPRFDHDNDTDYPLREAHANLDCQACHRENAFTEKPGTACVDCHRDDDPHDGELGAQCHRCHTETAWQANVVFDHDVSRFPLIGVHAAAACEDCHVTGALGKTDGECVSCHREEDAHGGNLGNECNECHTPNGWLRWRFDHDTQTDFALTGRHRDATCISCHREPIRTGRETPTQCYACHVQDNPHGRDFGRSCVRCHTTTAFSELRVVR